MKKVLVAFKIFGDNYGRQHLHFSGVFTDDGDGRLFAEDAAHNFLQDAKKDGLLFIPAGHSGMTEEKPFVYGDLIDILCPQDGDTYGGCLIQTCELNPSFA